MKTSAFAMGLVAALGALSFGCQSSTVCSGEACTQSSDATSGGDGGAGGSTTTGGGDGGSTTASGGTGGGAFCGGLAGIPCPSDQFCHFADGSCGFNDSGGVCEPRPAPNTCPVFEVAGPGLCACDGNVYESECEANASGTDLSQLHSCKAPQGQFWCGGDNLCQVATQLCWGVPGEGQFTCQPLPEACLDSPPVTCDCIEAQEPGHGCTGNATDGFTVVIFEK